jgi:hypothetical protein
MIYLSLLVISLWLAGYITTVYDKLDTGMLSDDLKKFISPPKWLYYLCGAPVSQKYPKGTMRVVAFRSQIIGISLVFYFIWYLIFKPSTPANGVGFGLSVLLALIMTSYVSKHYGLKNRSVTLKQRK